MKRWKGFSFSFSIVNSYIQYIYYIGDILDY